MFLSLLQVRGRPFSELTPLPNEIPPSEAGVIDQLTQPRFFGFQFQQLPNGTVALFLEDPNRVTPQPVETAPAEGDLQPTTPDTATTPE